METKKFLQRALGNTGYYCIFAARDGQKKQKFYRDLDALAHAASNFDSEGYDAYFALATFQEAGSREATNVQQMRSFYIDLDCGVNLKNGKPKPFATPTEAVRALQVFCKETGLPRPLLVNSGYGVHVYWHLEDPITVDEWLPVAERLKRLCKEKGFEADANVTADAARVLRVPGTNNYKDTEPKPVSYFGSWPPPVSLEQFRNALGDDPVPALPKKAFVPEANNAVMDALLGNKESVFKTIVTKTAAGKGCAQIGLMLKNPAHVDEPLWRAGLSIAKHCSDSSRAIHKLSQGHPEYDYDDTEAKTRLIKGPYLCARFDEYRPGICTGCPNYGKIKSPIVLGQQVREATDDDNVVQAPAVSAATNAPSNVTYLIPKYPKPYFRGANGGVYIRKVDDEGEVEEKCIYHNDLYVIRRIRDPEIGEGIVMRLHLPRDPVKEFMVPLTAVGSKEDFRKHMSAQGVGVLRMDDLMAYTMQWVNELQAQAEADEARRQFGWVGEGCTSFVLGKKEYFADRVGDNPPSAATVGLMPYFEPKGSLDGWKATMAFYDRPGFELHQYVVGTGFGSVLMQFLPLHSAALHLYSKDSGLGKTTAMLAALSIWGSPDKLVLQREDTYNHKMNRGELYHSLPFMLDEVTNMRGMELSDLAYQLTGGTQKGRMSSGSNAERHRGDPWKFLSVTTGNASVIEKISVAKSMPKAEAQRILEVRVDRIFKAPEDKEATDGFAAAIKQDYGWAGPVFVQYVLQNADAVKTLLAQVQKKIDTAAKLTAENRFWSAHTACTLTGILLAKKLNLIGYDTKAMFDWIVNVLLKENQRTTSDLTASVEDTLNDYINEHWNNFLWIKSTDDMRGKGTNGNGLDALVVPDSLPKGKLVGRYETDTKMVYLVPKFLKAWCGDQQINYGSFIQELTAKMGAKKVKVRLTKGTHMNLPATDAIVVECEYKGVIEDGTAAAG